MKLRTIICDANILIDYLNAGEDCLRAACSYAEVMVPDVVLNEVQHLDVEAAVGLGMDIIEVPLEVLAEAESRIPGCSMQDTVCFLLALKNEWICATNDGKLRKQCLEGGVATVRGFRLLADIVKAGNMTRARAKKAGKQIGEQNREITRGILEDFLLLLEEE